MAERPRPTFKQNIELKEHQPGIIPLQSVVATARSQRLRDAYFHTTINWSVGNVVDRRASELRDIHRFVEEQHSEITLDDFPLETDVFLSPDNKLGRLRRSTFMPLLPNDQPQVPGTAEFIDAIYQHGSKSEEDRAYFRIGGEGAPLMADFNRHAYQRIQEEYGLGSEQEAEKFFTERVMEANQILRRITKNKIPAKRNTLGLLNNTSVASSPGKLAFYALSPNVTRRLQFEALRTLTIAELLAKSEKHAEGLNPVLDDFQGAVDDKIFNHGQEIGETKEVTLYAIFDKETGAPKWNSLTDAKLTPEDHELYQQTGVLKRFRWNVRHAIGIGDVLTNPRTKGKASIFEKMIRDAEAREELVGDRYIEPAGVTDLGGLMHVLLSEKDLNGNKMKEFIAMHVALAKETFDQVEIVPHDNTKKGVGQSDEHEFRRVDFVVTRDGRKFKIEVIFKSLPHYLADEFKFGETDPKNGLPNGPAHDLYNAIRSTRAARRVFPPGKKKPGKKEYDLYGPQNWDKVTKREVKKVVKRLLNEDTINFRKLPKRYLQKSPRIEEPSPFAEFIVGPDLVTEDVNVAIG